MMQKIPTIYERDWEGNRGVICVPAFDWFDFTDAIATEKLDGTNVRLTVRNHTLVRLEKRRNPTKAQKAADITDPWYVDADENDPQDKHIWNAARGTDLDSVLDGEWSGEAIGPNIQGNPLGLPIAVVVLFSKRFIREFSLRKEPPAPYDFELMREWLQNEKSGIGSGLIEGIVWHMSDGRMVKIKTKDFK